MKVDVFIEIPMGSSVKYELDEEKNLLRADRFLYTAMSYPFNYGFIVETKAEDGDPLDALVLSSLPLYPGVLITCQPVGVLEMEDEEGIDNKLILVPVKKIDPVWGVIDDISKVPEPVLNKIKHFFDRYKELEPGKWVKSREFKGREIAEKMIQKASASLSTERSSEGE